MQQYFLLFKITFQMESENHNPFNIDFLGKLKKKYINKCKYYYILINMNVQI